MNNYYTTLQYQEFLDDDENSRTQSDGDKVFAKSVKSGYSKDITHKNPKYNKYYVRISPNKKLYDPFPKYSVSDNKASFIDKVCKSNNSYREVPESIFNMYLSYLRTENVQWYNKAQREAENLA